MSGLNTTFGLVYVRELLFSYFGFWPLTAQSFFLKMGLKWSEKSPKVKNESNCVPGREKEIPSCFGTRLADFQPQFSGHGAGNSQRGGRPWLLISSHIMVLLGLRLGTHTSRFKQKLRPVRAAPGHLNNSPASIPSWDPPPAMPRCCAVATTSPGK